MSCEQQCVCYASFPLYSESGWCVREEYVPVTWYRIRTQKINKLCIIWLIFDNDGIECINKYVANVVELHIYNHLIDVHVNAIRPKHTKYTITGFHFQMDKFGCQSNSATHWLIKFQLSMKLIKKMISKPQNGVSFSVWIFVIVRVTLIPFRVNKCSRVLFELMTQEPAQCTQCCCFQLALTQHAPLHRLVD